MDLTEIKRRINTLEYSIKNAEWAVKTKEWKLEDLKAEIAKFNEDIDDMVLELQDLTLQEQEMEQSNKIKVGEQVYIIETQECYETDTEFLFEALTEMGLTEKQKFETAASYFTPNRFPDKGWGQVQYIKGNQYLIRMTVVYGTRLFIMDAQGLSKVDPCPT